MHNELAEHTGGITGRGKRSQKGACLHRTRAAKEQMQELYQTQQQALRRYRWVETKEDRLFDILGPFLKSPYMALPTYMLHLKQSIWLYYHVRSHISWQVSDEALCEILYEEYLLYHGEINRQLALRILQRVKRSQEE